MTFKKRDPSITGVMRLPWLRTDPCPCGTGNVFANCCRCDDGGVYKAVDWPQPTGPATGYARSDCYMNWTSNCSPRASREHPVSRSVLALIGEKSVNVNGVSWLPQGESKTLPIAGLVAKILCERHNSAMSPLDAMAGKFFSAIRSIYDDIGDNSTLSRRKHWFLFSGEELELWLLKTAFGLFHSGSVAKSGQRLLDVQSINPTILQAFHRRPIAPPCGMYVVQDVANFVSGLHTMNFASLSSDGNERMVGLRLAFMGLALLVFLDPNATYNEEIRTRQAYRPSYLVFRNGRRTHTVVLTWPLGHPQNAVLFNASGPLRAIT